MNINTIPVVETAMLIRRPVAEVFEAFADPAVTSRFWFTRGSGRLEPGRTVRWDREMDGHSVDVKVKAVEPDRRIVIEWEGEPDASMGGFTIVLCGAKALLEHDIALNLIADRYPDGHG